MEKYEVLQVGPIKAMLDLEHAKLNEQYHVHKIPHSDVPDSDLAEFKDRIQTIVTNGHSGASAGLMDRLPNLKSIVCFGAGVDNVDLDHAAKKNIQVSNTPGVLNDDVANLAIGLLLASSRALIESDQHVRRGDWVKSRMPMQKAIRGERVGILGLGEIGKDIARKLEAFGCDIVYNGRRKQENVSYPYYSDLVEMAKDCAYLIIVCPATSETLRIVNREVIEALGSEGTLINIARGSVVDEPELIAALKDGRLGNAALDVFDNEPDISTEFFGMKNVVLAPHIGSATVAARRAMGNLMLENLALVVEGKAVKTPVSI